MAKAALIALAAAACGHGRSLACEREIAGLDAHLAAGAIAWFGELHGTEQSPRFVGDVACQAARRGKVQLALEIPSDEQPRLDRFLGDGERAPLLDGPFWRGRDGRSSEAMLALLERVRDLRAAGAAISVVAYDAPGEADRDAAMASFVARARDPGAVMVALSGNVHSRRTSFGAIEPAVARLVARGLTVTTFDVSSTGGTFWACVERDGHLVCGEQRQHRGEPGEPWTLGPPRDASHDAVYRVGETTASRPAAR
ncbi:MAG: hypothetical protein ACM31C_07705 [Acidobacteriota bacterium]